MNKILDKTDDLVSCIKNSPEYKKYINLKNKMSENQEIMKTILEIARK